MASRGHATDAHDRPLPPGPDGLPFLGSTLRLIRDPFGFIDDAREYGDVVSYRLAGIRFCALLHPDHVEQVLVREPERYRRWIGDEWNVLGEFGPEGLLVTEGEQWRRQRRLLQPAFTPDRLASHTEAMVEFTRRKVDRWNNGEVIALNREASRLTLRVLARSLFDLDVGGRDDVVTRAARAINDRADTRSLGSFLPEWVPTPTRRRSKRAMAALDQTMDELVAERRRNPGDHDDLLALLLDAADEDGASLTEAEVRDNLVTFLFAGHETTALALTYALVLLARHPAKRATLEAELDAVLGDAPPTPADLPELTYTSRVIDEALRLYPPAYVLFREATEDVTLEGYAIPAGTKLSLPAYNIHRDPRWFDDPEAFRPERWADDEHDRPDYAYFPFGGGPRHCIGMRFALLELKHVLPTIVRRVEFELLNEGDIAFQPGVTLQPADDIEVRVRRR